MAENIMDDVEYYDIRYHWNKIEKDFLRVFLKFLEDHGLSNPKDPPDFIAHFQAPSVWKLETTVTRVYTANDISELEEKLSKIIGVIVFQWKWKTLEPHIPFSFIQKDSAGELTINEERIKEVMKQREYCKTEETVPFNLPKDTSILYNKDKEVARVKAVTEAKEALGGLGFTQDEINLMSMGAAKEHDLGTLSPEELIRTLLQQKR